MVPWWSVGPSALADPCMTWRFWDEMGLAHGAMVPTWAGLVCVAQKGAQAVRLSGSVRPRPSERPREPSLMGPGGEGSRAILGIWGWAWTFPLGHLSLGGGLSSGVCSQPLPESWPCQGPASVRLSFTWKVPRGNPPPPFSQECWGPSGDHGLSWRLGVSLATGAFPSSSVFLQVRPGSNGRAMLWRLVWEVPSPRSERLMTKTLPLTGSGTWPAWRRYPMCDLSRPILARVLPGQSQGTHIR